MYNKLNITQSLSPQTFLANSIPSLLYAAQCAVEQTMS